MTPAENILKLLEAFPEAEAAALGGSRATGKADESSDYDVYVYVTSDISEDKRRNVFEPFCKTMEIGNRFWEHEDNLKLSDGICMDIIYRSLDEFTCQISEVVEGFSAHNSYTTCMWHNLISSQIIFDRGGRLKAARERFDVPYPDELRKNIIERNMLLLSDSLANYSAQIEKACGRGDRNSVNHRVSEFLASYFDVIFALNRMKHPGEKRLMKICTGECKILPHDFEENINGLFDLMGVSDFDGILHKIKTIAEELEKTVSANR
ncbi:MAG: DUF4037 domain-containing protein [Oscillospiraceae bacterium]|nr:DUF4037 domain-containing protein [Oscillospiraceae bacterium]